jgi:serine/threonine-protein kinase RsbW
VSGVTTMPWVHGVRGVMGLRVPGALAFRHIAIRLVSTACKMAIEAAHDGGPGSPPQGGGAGREEGDFEAEVVSAFGEAFNNIAIHGYRDRTPEPVHIEVDWDDEKIVITAIDTGHIFDPDTVAVPDLDHLHERGMGFFIMRSCMDVIEYSPGPPNVLRLVKRRARREGMIPPPPASHGAAGTPSSSATQEGATGGDELGHDRGAAQPDRGSGVQRTGGSDAWLAEGGPVPPGPTTPARASTSGIGGRARARAIR